MTKAQAIRLYQLNKGYPYPYIYVRFNWTTAYPGDWYLIQSNNREAVARWRTKPNHHDQGTQ